MFSLLSIPAIFHLNNLPAFINMLFFNVDGHLPYMPIGALWSISTEIQFYAAAPMLFVLLGKFARRLPLNLIVLLAVMATETGFRVFSFENGGLQNWYARAYAPLITNLDLFLIGMAASRVVLTLRNKNYLIESGLGLGFALFLALYVSMSYLRSQAVLAQSPIAGLLFTGYAPSLTAIVTALVLCGFELAPKYRPGSSIYRFGRPTEIIGTLTYAAYSWHEPVLLFLKHHIRPPATILASLGLFIPALVAILAIAAVLHYLIERPFEIRKKLV
jgi:peptidoglycan/LPS O-acetylase OafA/YrhL